MGNATNRVTVLQEKIKAFSTDFVDGLVNILQTHKSYLLEPMAHDAGDTLPQAMAQMIHHLIDQITGRPAAPADNNVANNIRPAPFLSPQRCNFYAATALLNDFFANHAVGVIACSMPIADAIREYLSHQYQIFYPFLKEYDELTAEEKKQLELPITEMKAPFQLTCMDPKTKEKLEKIEEIEKKHPATLAIKENISFEDFAKHFYRLLCEFQFRYLVSEIVKSINKNPELKKKLEEYILPFCMLSNNHGKQGYKNEDFYTITLTLYRNIINFKDGYEIYKQAFSDHIRKSLDCIWPLIRSEGNLWYKQRITFYFHPHKIEEILYIFPIIGGFCGVNYTIDDMHPEPSVPPANPFLEFSSPPLAEPLFGAPAPIPGLVPVPVQPEQPASSSQFGTDQAVGIALAALTVVVSGGALIHFGYGLAGAACWLLGLASAMILYYWKQKSRPAAVDNPPSFRSSPMATSKRELWFGGRWAAVFGSSLAAPRP